MTSPSPDDASDRETPDGAPPANPPSGTAAPWSTPADEVLTTQSVDVETGLSEDEVARRRRQHGRNRLRRARTRGAWQILLAQFQSIVVWLLAGAAGLSFAFGEWVDAAAIAAVVVINAAIGFITELRAVRSMESLRSMVRVSARVRRGGETVSVPAEELVPGDVVLLREGDIVTADLRLTRISKLEADEAALTGESVPVEKRVEPVDRETPLGDRSSMVFKGTAITRGSGTAVVVATGMQTELGHISELVEEAEEEVTPLEKRLDQLGQRLVVVTLVIAAAVAGGGILRGRDPLHIIETAIALAVATVPEGLPIVATLALARGMWRMARRNALIERLSAVETLGATGVICTDKTGTLTEGRMTVTRIRLEDRELAVTGRGLELEGAFRAADGSRDAENGHAEAGNGGLDPVDNPALRHLLRAGVLCNNASVGQEPEDADSPEVTGEPMEVALLVAGVKADMARSALLSQHPEIREVAFDRETRMMATIHRNDDGIFAAVKGAPEAVLAASVAVRSADEIRDLDDAGRDRWQTCNEDLASRGLRVLALAERDMSDPDSDPLTDLTLLGMVGLLDPPREDVRPALEACHSAGMRVVMVTGDHPETARRVAIAVGLVDDDSAEVVQGRDLEEISKLDETERARIRDAVILARVSPEQKLTLIDLHQAPGAVVAMTGDGVNDAPALKKADIGIAMGRRGTEVAREAADMILQDDAFSTIEVAVRQGRVIFENIRRFTLYLLSCNVSEIMVVGLATFAGSNLPLLPLQILYLNLVTDVFPALALGVGEGGASVMQHPPRDRSAPILQRRHWWEIGLYSSVIATGVLCAFFVAQLTFGMSVDQAVTVAFLSLATAQLTHVFNMRGDDEPAVRNSVTRNPWIWAALGLCVLLLWAAADLPGLSDLLRTRPIGVPGWSMVLAVSALPPLVSPLVRRFTRAPERR